MSSTENTWGKNSVDYTLKDLVEKDFISEEVALDLGNLTYKGSSVLVSGLSGVGKTSLLNALSQLINSDSRVVVVQHTPELDIDKKHFAIINIKDLDKDSDTINNLITNVWRMRSDYIVVDEVRDSHFANFVLHSQKMGHKVLSTIHSSNATKSMERLDAFMSQGYSKAKEDLSYLNDGLDIIVEVKRYEDGSRRVAAISEVPDFVKNGSLTPILLWEFVEDGTKDGKIFGHYERRNEISSAIRNKKLLDEKLSLTLEELYSI